MVFWSRNFVNFLDYLFSLENTKYYNDTRLFSIGMKFNDLEIYKL